MAQRYDIIIVGAGHNGLVAAGYLARAGRSVLVLERRPIVGGACVTEEIHPGYRCSTTSYVCSLLRPEIIRDLRLAEHGFELLPCSTTFVPFQDGSYLLLGGSAGDDAAQIARYSRRDAETYPRFQAALARLADFLRPTLLTTPPDLAAPGVGGLLEFIKMGGRFRKLAPSDKALLLKIMSMSVADFLDEWFESPKLKTVLAAVGTTGIYGSVRTPGTAYVLLHHMLGEADGEPGSWGFVRGGMGGLTQAMAAAAHAHGASVRTDAPVARILVEDGVARGVVLENGEEIAGRTVASNADPKRTFLQLLDAACLPADFHRGIENFRCAGNSGKVNLAVSELPDFGALPGKGPHLRGSIMVAGDRTAYLEEAFRDFEIGRPSRRPYLEVTIPSALDDSLCPAGHHVLSISIKYTCCPSRSSTCRSSWPKATGRAARTRWAIWPLPRWPSTRRTYPAPCWAGTC
jgi:phytoene dehydrogenase-like protein